MQWWAYRCGVLVLLLLCLLWLPRLEEVGQALSSALLLFFGFTSRGIGSRLLAFPQRHVEVEGGRVRVQGTR